MNGAPHPLTPSNVRLVDSRRGALLTVRVVPRASRTLVDGVRAEALVVRVTAPPADDAANASLLDLLADVLAVPSTRLSIARGRRGRLKQILIAGLDAAEVGSRLASGWS